MEMIYSTNRNRPLTMMKSLLRKPGILVAALAAWLTATPLTLLAATCSKTSPAHTIALLELYTSEGCDSCPNADRFVSNLAKSMSLTSDQVIPLSLHVDYWDYIGWKDAFAKPVFTQRQRQLAQLANSRTVYTPEFFLAGRELREWRNNLSAEVARINRQAAQANIQLTINKLESKQLFFSVSASSTKNAHLYFALVEQSIVSKIMAGENRGATLQHDFVAREWGDPIPFNASVINTQNRQLPIPSNAVFKNLSLLAFVQSDKGEVLQALSLPLCSNLF